MRTPKFIIYGLIDPRDGQLRYVGKSCSGLNRPARHFREFPPVYRTNWIREVLATGLRPEIEVLEEHARAEDLPEAERFWIAYYRGLGCRLTNLTDGGEGMPGRVVPKEVRIRIASTLRGRRRPPEVGRKVSAALSGRQLPLEHRMKIAEAVRQARHQARN